VCARIPSTKESQYLSLFEDDGPKTFPFHNQNSSSSLIWEGSCYLLTWLGTITPMPVCLSRDDSSIQYKQIKKTSTYII
jgi:hypothetical protein